MERAISNVQRKFRLISSLLMLSTGIVLAQQAAPMDPELAQGLRYVQGLQKLQFSDIADEIISDLEVRFPEARAHVARLRLEGDLARGLFDNVIAVIKAMPDQNSIETWSMKLALADSYYAYARYPEAKGIYNDFFKTFSKETPPALQSFYNDSAYKYAQMLIYLKELKGALEAYKRVVAAPLEPHVMRQCEAEMADVCLRLAAETSDKKAREELYKQAEELADKLLWVQDIWFGKAIVLKAHIAMLRGKPDTAKKLVDDYMSTLQAIHEALVEQEAETGDPLTRISPMSECRYLLAVLLQEESEKQLKEPKYDREAVLSMLVGTKDKDGKRKGDGAYQHFINVFLKYPESAWAAEAGERAEQVRAIITDVFGGTIKAVVTAEQAAKVRGIQYRDARMLYMQGQIDNAKETLSRVLNQFPDVPESVGALGDLARCYIQTIVDDPDNELYADTVIAHLAERYSSRSDTRSIAGDEVIRLAEYWLEAGRADKRSIVYNLFFDNFPTHSMAASYLLSFGERSYQDKDYPTALGYFNRVVESYAGSSQSFSALNRIATVYEETHDTTNQIKATETYVAALKGRDKPGQELMSALYRRAQAYRDSGLALLRGGSTNETDIVAGNEWLKKAIVDYNELDKAIADPDNPYQSTDKDRETNAALREAALYNMAYCLSQISRPAANISALRRRAIESYEMLVKSFPKSDLAPTALIQVGSIWTMERDAAKAEETLSRLLRTYPDSKEARSALPMIADNLMKLGMREEAVPRYRQMFAETGGKYSDSDLLRAAQVLAEAREFDLAQQGLERIMARSKDTAIIAPARLAQARLHILRADFATAVEELKRYVDDFKGYALTIDASELLSQAASEAGMRERDDNKRKMLFNEAVDAIKVVQQRRTNMVEAAAIDIEVGRIMGRKARAEVEFDKPAAAEDSRGRAIIAYQAFIDSADPANTALAPLIETAYVESVPLLLEHRRWEFAAESCEDYLTAFPNGRHVAQMRTWLNQAHIEMGTSRRPAPQAEPGEEPAVEPTAYFPIFKEHKI